MAVALSDQAAALRVGLQGERRFLRRLPRPRIARPDLRQQVERRGAIAAILNRHAHHDIFRRIFRIFDMDIEIRVVFEHARVEHFVLGHVRAAAAVFGNEIVVGERGMRVLVQHAHVGMRRRAVDVEVQLLHVLAVVALRIRQPEQPFLENRVEAVPHRERDAPVLVVVAESGNAVFAPAVGATARMIVREIVPGGAVFAVVLAHRAPLTLAEIRPPALPARAVGGMEPGSFYGVE